MPRRFTPSLICHLLTASVAFFGVAAVMTTDLAYIATANMQWTNMSSWLLSAALLANLVALAFGFFHIARAEHTMRGMSHLIYSVTLSLIAVVLLFDVLVHTHDAYTSVVPGGIALTILAFLLTLVAVGSGLTAINNPSPRQMEVRK